jgi:hypothetical protein
MSFPMLETGCWRRIEVHEPWWDFELGVWTALERLGYELVPAGQSAGAPDARIMAADRLEQLSAEATGPIVLIGEPGSRGEDDPRVIGIVRPRASLADLYPLLQSALEEHPRAVPRIPTSLLARSFRGDVDAPGAILCLSEKGCLLQSVSSLSGAGPLHVQFRLPNGWPVYTRAEPRHEAGNHSGLAFVRLPEFSREAITEFVMESLTQGL